jgi:hypothetical protein
MAALAALGATAALAVSSPSANAQVPLHYAPPVSLCYGLVYGIRGALAVGNPLRANVLSQTFIYLGCGGAAI